MPKSFQGRNGAALRTELEAPNLSLLAGTAALFASNSEGLKRKEDFGEGSFAAKRTRASKEDRQSSPTLTSAGVLCRSAEGRPRTTGIRPYPQHHQKALQAVNDNCVPSAIFSYSSPTSGHAHHLQPRATVTGSIPGAQQQQLSADNSTGQRELRGASGPESGDVLRQWPWQGIDSDSTRCLDVLDVTRGPRAGQRVSGFNAAREYVQMPLRVPVGHQAPAVLQASVAQAPPLISGQMYWRNKESTSQAIAGQVMPQQQLPDAAAPASLLAAATAADDATLAPLAATPPAGVAASCAAAAASCTAAASAAEAGNRRGEAAAACGSPDSNPVCASPVDDRNQRCDLAGSSLGSSAGCNPQTVFGSNPAICTIASTAMCGRGEGMQGVLRQMGHLVRQLDLAQRRSLASELWRLATEPATSSADAVAHQSSIGGASSPEGIRQASGREALEGIALLVIECIAPTRMPRTWIKADFNAASVNAYLTTYIERPDADECWRSDEDSLDRLRRIAALFGQLVTTGSDAAANNTSPTPTNDESLQSSVVSASSAAVGNAPSSSTEPVPIITATPAAAGGAALTEPNEIVSASGNSADNPVKPLATAAGSEAPETPVAAGPTDALPTSAEADPQGHEITAATAIQVPGGPAAAAAKTSTQTDTSAALLHAPLAPPVTASTTTMGTSESVSRVPVVEDGMAVEDDGAPAASTTGACGVCACKVIKRSSNTVHGLDDDYVGLLLEAVRVLASLRCSTVDGSGGRTARLPTFMPDSRSVSATNTAGLADPTVTRPHSPIHANGLAKVRSAMLPCNSRRLLPAIYQQDDVRLKRKSQLVLSLSR